MIYNEGKLSSCIAAFCWTDCRRLLSKLQLGTRKLEDIGWMFTLAFFIQFFAIEIFIPSGENLNHRDIILNRGIMPRKKTEESDAILRNRSVQRRCVTSFETAHPLANGPGWGEGWREKYVFCVPRELQRLLSLFCLWEESVGGA